MRDEHSRALFFPLGRRNSYFQHLCLLRLYTEVCKTNHSRLVKQYIVLETSDCRETVNIPNFFSALIQASLSNLFLLDIRYNTMYILKCNYLKEQYKTNQQMLVLSEIKDFTRRVHDMCVQAELGSPPPHVYILNVFLKASSIALECLGLVPLLQRYLW